MTHHFTMKLQMCPVRGNKRKKFTIYASLYKPYILCLFLECTFNQPCSQWCLKCLLEYTEAVEYFILNMIKQRTKKQGKAFSFHFFQCPFNYILFKE